MCFVLSYGCNTTASYPLFCTSICCSKHAVTAMFLFNHAECDNSAEFVYKYMYVKPRTVLKPVKLSTQYKINKDALKRIAAVSCPYICLNNGSPGDINYYESFCLLTSGVATCPNGSSPVSIVDFDVFEVADQFLRLTETESSGVPSYVIKDNAASVLILPTHDIGKKLCHSDDVPWVDPSQTSCGETMDAPCEVFIVSKSYVDNLDCSCVYKFNVEIPNGEQAGDVLIKSAYVRFRDLLGHTEERYFYDHDNRSQTDLSSVAGGDIQQFMPGLLIDHRFWLTSNSCDTLCVCDGTSPTCTLDSEKLAVCSSGQTCHERYSHLFTAAYTGIPFDDSQTSVDQCLQSMAFGKVEEEECCYCPARLVNYSQFAFKTFLEPIPESQCNARFSIKERFTESSCETDFTHVDDDFHTCGRSLETPCPVNMRFLDKSRCDVCYQASIKTPTCAVGYDPNCDSSAVKTIVIIFKPNGKIEEETADFRLMYQFDTRSLRPMFQEKCEHFCGGHGVFAYCRLVEETPCFDNFAEIEFFDLMHINIDGANQLLTSSKISFDEISCIATPCNPNPCLEKFELDKTGFSSALCQIAETDYVCECGPRHLWDSDSHSCVEHTFCDDAPCEDLANDTPEAYANGKCILFPDKYECACNGRYEWNSLTKQCIGADFCSPNLCQEKYDKDSVPYASPNCFSRTADFHCDCNNGFEWNGPFEICIPRGTVPVCDSCLDKYNKEKAAYQLGQCSGTFDFYNCLCNNGYKWDFAEKLCRLSNPCSLDLDPCSERYNRDPHAYATPTCHYSKTTENYQCDCNEVYDWNPDSEACESTRTNPKIADPCEPNGCEELFLKDSMRYANADCDGSSGTFACNCSEGFLWNQKSEICLADMCHTADSCGSKDHAASCVSMAHDYACECIDKYVWVNSEKKCKSLLLEPSQSGISDFLEFFGLLVKEI